jgi:hypothetical protein
MDTATVFTLVKTRGGSLVITSPAIDWSALSEEAAAKQWLACTNVVWEMERDGKISKDNLEPFFFEYMRKHYSEDDIKKIKGQNISLQLLAMAFLFVKGAVRPDSETFFNSKIKERLAVDAAPEVEAQPEKPKRNIQDAMADQLSNLLGELQGYEDELKLDMFGWMQSANVPKVHITAITEYYKPRLEELQAALDGDDDSIVEGYSPYKKKEIQRMLKWYEQLMIDLDAYNRLKQATRKVRTSKPKPASKLVAKLKHMHHSEEFKINSIKPETIVGADTLWLFNTKTRKLCMYVASSTENELTVKGTYVVGWDPRLSYGKNLRKPADQLATFMAGGKVQMRNFLKAIRGKDATLNGKINKDVILLKAY